MLFRSLLFAAASTEICVGIAQFPHSRKLDSEIRPHVHWSPTTTGSGNVLWRLEYVLADINGTFPGTYTAIDALAAAGGVVGAHQIKSFPAIDASEVGLSAIMCWKLSRIGGDATDTYAADARLFEFDIHYEIDTIGSDDELAK